MIGAFVALMVIEDSPLVIGGIHIGLHNEEVLKAAEEAASKFLGQLRLQRSDLALKTDHRVGNAVETILEALGMAAPGGSAPVRIVQRPVTHHPRNQRMVV